MSYTYTIDDLHKDIVVGIRSNTTQYLYNRIQRIDYRGEHLSQHNRYTRDTIIVILQELDKILRNNDLPLLRIRTTDISKRPDNTLDESHYTQLTSSIAAIESRVTQDSLRKNFFVDMARMGFINRFDSDRMPNDAFSRSKTEFVNISDFGYKFLNEVNSVQQNLFNIDRIWTDALTNLHNGFKNILYSFMLNLKAKGVNSISYDEFAFFVSDIRKTQPSQILALLLEFRSFSPSQRELIIDSIKKYANPKENSFFSGSNKTQVKDYRNWINEAQQLFMLWSDSVLFGVGDFREKELNIRVGDLGPYCR